LADIDTCRGRDAERVVPRVNDSACIDRVGESFEMEGERKSGRAPFLFFSYPPPDLQYESAPRADRDCDFRADSATLSLFRRLRIKSVA
tara:strand:+ start:119 stop:385 length:267 start_codon:yes stop_codon:yes gene_type:complete